MSPRRNLSNAEQIAASEVQRARSFLRKAPQDSRRTNNFVPALSVFRTALLTDESQYLWRTLRSKLGRHFEVYEPQEWTIKTVNQRGFIDEIRDKGFVSTGADLRRTAEKIRSGLRGLKDDSNLLVPLGRLSVFGDRKQALALELSGWKGYNGRYAVNDEANGRLGVGVIATEGLFCLGTLRDTFGESFSDSKVLRTPHVTVARNFGGIKNHGLKDIRSIAEGLLPMSLEFGDPVVHMNPAPGKPPLTFAV